MAIPLPRTLALATALLVCLDAQAGTVTRRMSINPYGSDIAQGSSSGPGATYGIGFSPEGSLGAIAMPDPSGGLSKFSIGFTLPDDYAPGTEIYLRVVWRSQAISCVIDLRNNNVNWARPGALNDNGALIKDATMLAPNDNRLSMETKFRFNFVPRPPFAGGDTFILGLFRSSTLDSCDGTLYIQGLAIEYQALTQNLFRDGFEAVT
ncbi:hypothetical protein [Chiayiivirga flava]|uniref:Uncharacterized protein n=1 Tax=Chiayiivirga flava TaxID=659595 RepID=A0A7W8G230_9GAMM|nr:hypothetical protein [Chiayiivirga flava]MBB5208250.1 hypothetical protein [Chiayiivirga flava]